MPGYEGHLWAADPAAPEGSLRRVFARDFARYGLVERFVHHTTNLFTLAWAPWKWADTPSMYTNHTGFGMLNPFNIVPLYSLCRAVGVSEAWWDIIFTPHYTASFLVDEVRDGMEWSGMGWSGGEWNILYGVVPCRRGARWNGVEWNGVEWSGIEYTARRHS